MNKNQGMRLKQLAASIAASAAVFAGGAVAGPTPVIYNADNTAGATFTNFDWASNGTAFTTGFAPTNAPGSTFTLTYFAAAASVDGGAAVNPHIDGKADAAVAGSTYEYTIVATLQETLVGCTPDFTTCTFRINGGNFNVYYDNNTAHFANNTGGTGFDDGLVQISANILASSSTQTFSTTAGFNVTGVQAQIYYTDTNPGDPAHITPALTTANTITTLQIGGARTATPASGFDGTAFNAGNVVFQADGNTAFAVPEPGSIALFGLGAVALGLGYRRRRKSA